MIKSTNYCMAESLSRQDEMNTAFCQSATQEGKPPQGFLVLFLQQKVLFLAI